MQRQPHDHDSYMNHWARRSGVTLLEVLLVLAILVAIAGFAVPTIESMITSRRITDSLEQLMNDIGEARVRAIRTGQAQVFKATLNGRDYSISPWLGMNDEIDAAAGSTVTTSTGLTLQTQAVQGGGVATSTELEEEKIFELAEGVQFFAVDTLVDSKNAAAISSEGGEVPVAGAAPTSSSESSPVLLYPDGSSTTAQIIIVDDKGRRMAIQIRGVVGQMSKLRVSSVDPSTISFPQ